MPVINYTPNYNSNDIIHDIFVLFSFAWVKVEVGWFKTVYDSLRPKSETKVSD